ncbi:hypothetical protein Nepgr_029832 [Nepenthes gracilis]|uniref:Integrase catalytic domain-containing protein n=1 Tax=Nepenthes gracilis TaxID=150966 RepID=A0AAD3Y5H1_NEPGR|nr:hypothetical protein Nepgr_029832 [Nepenthes gracilis]
MAAGQRKFLIVGINYFTKLVEAVPLTKITEQNATEFLRQGIICRFGIPEFVVTDNGTQFTGKRFTKYCRDLRIKLIHTPVAHPQANGQVKVTNRTLLHGLKTRGGNAKPTDRMLRSSHQRTKAPGKSGPALQSSRRRITTYRGLSVASCTVLQQTGKGTPTESWRSGPPERRGGGKDRKQEQTLSRVGGAVPRLRNPPEWSVQAARPEWQTGPADLERRQPKKVLSVMLHRLRLPLSREDNRPSVKPVLGPVPVGPKSTVPGLRPHVRRPGDDFEHIGPAPMGPSGPPEIRLRARQPGERHSQAEASH